MSSISNMYCIQNVGVKNNELRPLFEPHDDDKVKSIHQWEVKLYQVASLLESLYCMKRMHNY